MNDYNSEKNNEDLNLNNSDFDDDEVIEGSPKFNKIYAEDESYLNEFNQYLHEKGLRPKTIRNHLENIRFFLIDFLLYYEGETMQEGIHSVSLFLGDWFIRKATWSTEYTIKQNIASFKKFYKCMYEKGNISKEDYDYLIETIKEDKNEWIEDVNQYNYDFDRWYDKYYDF